MKQKKKLFSVIYIYSYDGINGLQIKTLKNSDSDI